MGEHIEVDVTIEDDTAAPQEVIAQAGLATASGAVSTAPDADASDDAES